MTLRCAGVTRAERWSGSLTVPSNGDLGMAKDDWEPAPSPFKEHPASFLRLDARRLGEPSFSDEEAPALDPDGYGLGMSRALDS